MDLNIKKTSQGDIEDASNVQSISDYLRSCRIQKNIALSSVSQTLRIRQDFIVALEEGNVKYLPERVYTLGFVRSYARFLGIDIENTLNRFKLEVLGDAQQMPYSLPVPINENTTPHKWLIIFSATIGLMILAGWFFFLNDASHSEKTLPVPQPVQEAFTKLQVESEQETSDLQVKKEEVLSEPASTNFEEPTQATGETPSYGSHLSVIEPTWVEIRDSHGKILEKKIFQVGESLPTYPFHIELTVGNAGGILISKNNETQPLGKPGAVIRGLRIQPQ